MEWMDLLLEATQAALPAAAPEELEQLVGAMAFAKYQPCEEWAHALFGAMQPHLASVGAYNPKVIRNSLLFLRGYTCHGSDGRPDRSG